MPLFPACAYPMRALPIDYSGPLPPGERPAQIKSEIDLTASPDEQGLTLNVQARFNERFSRISTIYMDNSLNLADVTLAFLSGESFVVQSFTSGFLPTPSGSLVLTVSCLYNPAVPADLTIPFVLYNIPIGAVMVRR